MNTYTGYSKRNLDNTNLLGAGGGHLNIDKVIPFIVGTQSSSTSSWTGSLQGTGITSLTNGLTIHYFLNQAPSTSNVTLNLTYDDATTTGAIECYYSSERLTNHYSKWSVITFTYVESGQGGITSNRWVADADYNTSNIRLYRRSSGYNDDYPLLVSNSNSITTTIDSFTNVYAMIWNDSEKIPTLNPSTGEVKVHTLTAGYTVNADAVLVATFISCGGLEFPVSNNTVLILAGTVSSDIILTLPASTGTIALTSQIPSVSSWALQSTKPSYTFNEINPDGNSVVTAPSDRSIRFDSKIASTASGLPSINGDSNAILTINRYTGNKYCSQLLFTADKRLMFRAFKSVEPDTTTAWKTVAFTSDIPSLSNYVTLNGTLTISGNKTLSGSTSIANLKIADSNGAYYTDTVGDYQFTSNGYSYIKDIVADYLTVGNVSINIYQNTCIFDNLNTNGTFEFLEDVKSTAFIVDNGTSSQFLKADGSLDSNTYITNATGLGLSHNTLYKNLTSTTVSGNTWENAFGIANASNSWLFSFRTGTTNPNWIPNNYSSGIAFGGEDTKGVISIAFGSTSTTKVTFAGGNSTAPQWYFSLNGTSGTVYDLDNLSFNISSVLGYTTANNNYAVELDSSTSKLYVNVPWANDRVTLMPATDNSEYYILFKGSNTSTLLTYGVRFCNKLKVNASTGNVTSSGNFYANSDIRYKNIIKYLDNLTLEDIANLPIFDYIWKDSDKKEFSGTSAQDVQKILPNLVEEGSDGKLSLNYATLGVIASIVVARALVEWQKK